MANNTNEKKKILLVDDDEMHLLTAELLLKDEYEICKAKSGNEALQYLCNDLVPDLILLDIIMPNMDGWETYNKIKGISLLKNVPVAFLTGVEEEADKKLAYKKGIADYITKPYNMTELKSRIKDILKKYEIKKVQK